MSKWSFNVSSWTPTAVADTTAMTYQGMMGYLGGTATERTDLLEVFMGGAATSSAPMLMVVARDSTVCATPTALTTNEKYAAMDPATANLATQNVALTGGTTMSKRSSTLGQLVLPFNAFGGLARWHAGQPGEEVKLLGSTASFGEISLSMYTGGTAGLMGSHMLFEEF